MTGIEREEALSALAGLLEEFRRGQIVSAAAERRGIEQHARALNVRWDEAFPGFPKEHFPYTSFRGQHYRRRRDAHLKDIIVRVLSEYNSSGTTVVNPACVFGRHACELASRLPRARVVGTDIDPGWHRIYRLARGRRFPDNYSFRKENIFTPRLDLRPTAVVFFGACGPVTDGAIDYALDSGALYLMCRTCCHDNIGGNLEIIKRPNSVNRFFRFKNWAYGRMSRNARYAGFYFSDKYPRTAYPRSASARTVSDPDEFRTVARYSPDSDICRAIIDLDRCLHLMERKFSVLYQGELLVAGRGEGNRNAFVGGGGR